MKFSKPGLLLVIFIIMGMIGTKSFAELSPTEILMKATTLTCTFTSEQQTRWGSGGRGGFFFAVDFNAQRSGDQNFGRR